MPPRTQAHFTADDVIISLPTVPKSCPCACACDFTDHRGEKVSCLEKLDVVFDHFQSLFALVIYIFHTQSCFLKWQQTGEKNTQNFWRNQGDIFGNASCLSQLKYSWTQGRTKLKSKLIQSENKAYKTRQLTKCRCCVTVLTEKAIQLDKWKHLISRECEQIIIFIELLECQ